MARLPARSREDLPEEGRRVYDEIVASRGEVDEAFQVLLPTPELLRRIAHLGAYIRFGSSLPASIRECIILAAAHEMQSEFEWASHEPQARRAGVSEDTLRSIRNGEVPSGREEGAVVQLVHEALRHHRLTEATFQRVQSAFGVAGTTEIAATLGYYALLGNILNVFDVGR
jgi:4-carboxymuconolactone decarboxylase